MSETEMRDQTHPGTAPEREARDQTHPELPPPPPAGAYGRGYTVAGFICAVIALVFLPIVLGPLGAVLGYVGQRKGDQLGRWALIAGVAATVVGLLLGVLLFSAAQSGGG